MDTSDDTVLIICFQHNKYKLACHWPNTGLNPNHLKALRNRYFDAVITAWPRGYGEETEGKNTDKNKYTLDLILV